MTMLSLLGSRWRLGRSALASLTLLTLAGCENKLLEFTDPDIITGANSSAGAVALRNGTIQRFTTWTLGNEGPDALFAFAGLLTDEMISGDTFEQRNTTDQRDLAANNTFLAGMTLGLNQVRTQGRLAINSLRVYATNPNADVGLMFALGGFSEVLQGEHYCNGIVLSSLVDGEEILGSPITVDSVFRLAIASADSALAVAGSDVKVGNLARIVKGRALLNLGRFPEAAAAVASVPTSYKYDLTFSANTIGNFIWGLNNNIRRYVVPEREGTNGLPWRTAKDPRLPVVNANQASFDGTIPAWYQNKWTQFSPVSIATGVEARLIEAEAALQGGQAATWLAKHNEARATVAGLAALTDPGTTAARVDLHFYERGFWFWGLGHRLGDLRRLVRQYARSPETVFPTGGYHRGGNYGTSYNIPVPFQETNNSNVTPNTGDKYGSSCINRNP